MTGPVTSHAGAGIAIATASQGGRNIMQTMGRETVRGLIGSTFPEAVPTLGAAAPGAITASTAIGAVGLGVTIFVSTTYLVRGWIEDAVEITHGWELVPEQSGYGDPDEPPTRSDPFWRRCSEVRDCPEQQGPPAPQNVLPGGGAVPGIPAPGGTGTSRAGAGQGLRGLGRWTWLLGGLLLLLAVALMAWPGGGSEPAVVGQPPVTASPAATTTATAATPTATATPGIVTGGYRGAVTVANDPAGHRCCVAPSDRWEVLQVRNTQTGAITITLSNVLPGVTLTGPVPGVGQQFTASGTGTVAGYPNTLVAFTGTASAEAGVNGTLTVGANGSLPQGQAITFTAALKRVP